MQIIVAKNAGFCFGVKRAIDITEETLKKCQKPIYMLGEIVHNEQVVKKLKESGIKFVDNLDKIKKGTVIIRTHGASPKIFENARSKGLKIIDATCPIVSNIHLLVKKLPKDYQIIIAGDKNHDEILGILGESKNKILVVENAKELEGIKSFKKVALFSQTTQSFYNFKTIIEKLLENCSELRIFNTICPTTVFRQSEVEKLAKKTDIMIIIGSKTSANTMRLVDLSKKSRKPAYRIDNASQLKKNWFRGIKRIGVSAGASTPDWIIKEVVDKLKLLEK